MLNYLNLTWARCHIVMETSITCNLCEELEQIVVAQCCKQYTQTKDHHKE